jgi:hypothetical protein
MLTVCTSEPSPQTTCMLNEHPTALPGASAATTTAGSELVQSARLRSEKTHAVLGADDSLDGVGVELGAVGDALKAEVDDDGGGGGKVVVFFPLTLMNAPTAAAMMPKMPAMIATMIVRSFLSLRDSGMAPPYPLPYHPSNPILGHITVIADTTAARWSYKARARVCAGAVRCVPASPDKQTPHGVNGRGNVRCRPRITHRAPSPRKPAPWPPAPGIAPTPARAEAVGTTLTSQNPYGI